MRILHLTPGTGNFHCGSCLRDNALIKALRSRGHDALMVPLYLPLVTDREAANPEIPVQAGGITLFLQQKFPWMRHLPRWFHRWLSRPDYLRFASRFISLTSPRDLGEMTVGALVGEQGNQWGEWKQLVEWINDHGKPDVISLSNSLLMGLCKTFNRDLGLPVIVSLQGEDSFLDTLVEPYREQAWAAMRENAQYVTRFVAPSRFYADLMAERLEVSRDKIAVVYNGLDMASFVVADADPNAPVIGYFARMIHGKGLTTLVDAFIELVQRKTLPRVKLKIGGSKTAADEKYVNELMQKLKAAGCENRVEWHPNLSYADKLKFFRNVSVFSVPATYGEAFGLYLIEAIASGVPVVQPEHGAFPELVALSEGGILCAPDNPTALADALESVLKDEQLRDQLSNRGMARVRNDFSATRMADHFEEVLRSALNNS